MHAWRTAHSVSWSISQIAQSVNSAHRKSVQIVQTVEDVQIVKIVNSAHSTWLTAHRKFKRIREFVETDKNGSSIISQFEIRNP